MRAGVFTAIAWLAATSLVVAAVDFAQAAPSGSRGAQGRGAAQTPAASATAKASAPVDLTGYWVSIITEDWRWRMVMPPKGDYQSVPINAEAKRIADMWDAAKDESAGEQCRAYGAAGLMRLPTRLRVTWLDDNTLKVETDAGLQTRLLHFGPWKSDGRASWQGDSIAEWDLWKRPGGQPNDQEQKFGSLKVVTTNMRPGYLRKNGIPYSAKARLTEYWDVHKGRNGEQWLVVSTTIEDPAYLQIPWLTSPNFKKEADGSKWDPTPCTGRR
jgi:hypothetical protein